MDPKKARRPEEGIAYQMLLQALFALSGIKNFSNWTISNEVTSAGKFDDLVFESDEKCMLLQAKVKSGMTYTKDFMAVSPIKKICEFSIAMYLLSYITFKKSFKITRNSLILCTAATLKVADIMDELPANEYLQQIFGNKILMYKIKNEEEMVEKLLDTVEQFKNNIDDKDSNEEKKQWKRLVIDREDIKSFISSFVVVNIKLKKIKSLIKSKLSELKYEFPISSYEYVKDHVEEWSNLSLNNFVPMTKDYLMFILYGEYNRNFLQKLVNTKIYFKESYQFNSGNIICVQAHDNIAIYLLKILRSIQKSEASSSPIEENTLCLMQEMVNTVHTMKYTMEYKVISDMINTFRCNKIKYLVVSFLSLNEDQALELYKKIYMITREDPSKKVFIIIKENDLQKRETLVKIINDKIYFNSLETDTQQYILSKKISFQGELVTLMNLINNIKNINSDEIEIDECLTKIIFNEDNYSIGSNLQTQSKPEQFYFERSLKANSEVFPETKFFEKINKNILVVTGPPGEGKTTLLKQIVSLKKAKDKIDSKLTWIINVDLKKSKQFFRNAIGKTLSDLLCHNENITPASSYLAQFERKLIESMNKILIIDGLDENCLEDIEKIRNLFVDQNSLQDLNISLVIIGARDYDFILKKLRILDGCELVRFSPFSPRDQSSFLKGYLNKLIPANTEHDIFEKVTNFAPAFKDICSTPLSLQMVSKIIKNKISKGDSIESSLKVFYNVSNLYHFYSYYLGVRKDEFAQDDDIYRLAFDRYIYSLRKLAASNLFSDHLLSLLNVDASFEIGKDALNVGVLKEAHEGYEFVHKTFEEYFAAELIWDCLNKKKLSYEVLLEILNTVFLNNQYVGVSDFFEKILEINQDKDIVSRISMEYNLALTKVNWRRDISLLCFREYICIIKLVFSNYTFFADVLNIESMSGEAPLHISCLYPSLDKYIVKEGLDVNKADENSLTYITCT
ncbi:uncharacterized protein LOC126886943 [Diabrotica virgifera virgifera]|uniref:Uncharacterized protein LOC114340283 n=1 Tax=Diabrotica virgifera virgifera TaxID=50390 RepID=A0A6P7GBZ9_DIAVI|nr:uncharacterized protein LOC126886943 [Diabrotica virgifera virgifera]